MTSTAYVPILTGKNGEFAALGAIPYETRAVVSPILDIPPLAEDKRAEGKVDRLLSGVARAFGDQSFFAVDLEAIESDPRRDGGTVTYMLDRVAMGAAVGIGLAVRTDAAETYVEAIRAEHHRSAGVCVRAQVRPHVSPERLAYEVDAMLSRLGVAAHDTHLCLDCGDLLSWPSSPRPAETMKAHLARDLSGYKLASLAATSVPPGASIDRGYQRFQRREWAAWRKLRGQGLQVAFGDYGITGPRPTSPPEGQPDPYLRYTTEAALLSWRGWRSDRLPSERANEPHSFSDLCRQLVEDDSFAGPDFSEGDQAFSEVAAGTRTNRLGDTTQGSVSQWVQWATSHHIAHVLHSLRQVD